MKKPYVICHMLQSIDGRISGDFFSDSETSQLTKHYSKIGNQYEADAVMYGRVTAEEIFSLESMESFSDEPSSKQEDYVLHNDIQKWIIVFDPSGSRKWTEESLMNSRLKNKKVLIILSNKVSDSYIEKLKNLGISYLFGGLDNINLQLIMQKLYEQCGIKRVLLQGGGIINASLVNENLVDEISLIISPNINCCDYEPMCFEESTFSKGKTSIAYTLVESKVLSSSGVWLNYKIRQHWRE